MPKKILIIGAGYGGIETALTLYKKKRKRDDIEIAIVDKNSYHTLLTELHEVAGNRISEDGVIVPLKDIFKYTDINVIRDEIEDIDFEKNKVVSSNKEYSYDYLVLAVGSETNYYDIPGLKEHSFSLWSYNDAIRIREHIKSCFITAAQTKDPALRKTLLTFIVGGGGFTGVEMIGELAQWVKSLCKEYGINRTEVDLKLIEALPKILNNLKDESVNKTVNYLTKSLKVDVLTSSAITRLTEDSVELKDGRKISTKTLIWTAGVRACCISDKAAVEKGKACKIKVNKFSQTQYNNVYAVGDISCFETEGDILPALVEAALQTGKGTAKNILRAVRGETLEEIKPKLHGVMVSVGSFFGVTDLMGVQLPRPFAIFMKYFVNMHYLFGIGGFELVIKYIKHEFLNKKQRKFILEKHYSMMTPTFWLVPIRLFLGYSWLMEGIGKLQEGWLTNAFLAGKAPDVESSASITETGEKVFRIVSSHTPSWYAWIADNIVVPNALVFQWLIVLTEIGLGLAFITGTFTFIAALAALGLNFNFLLSTGLYETSWWYIPAALCMLGGAGRAFGVDFYLIPYLMRQWRYFVRNRRIKLFLFS